MLFKQSLQSFQDVRKSKETFSIEFKIFSGKIFYSIPLAELQYLKK